MAFVFYLTSGVTVQSVQVMINFYFHRSNSQRNWVGWTARANEIRHRKPIQGHEYCEIRAPWVTQRWWTLFLRIFRNKLPIHLIFSLEAGEWAGWPGKSFPGLGGVEVLHVCVRPTSLASKTHWFHCRKDLSPVCHLSTSLWQQKQQIIQTEVGAVLFLFPLSLLSCSQLPSSAVVERATKWGI